MSLAAYIWVRKYAAVNNATELCILYSLADRANDDGTGAWPAYGTIAHEARCSERTVIRHINKLEERGVIVRGTHPTHSGIPSRRRPVCWDINMDAVREDAPEDRRKADKSGRGDNLTPQEDVQVSRGDNLTPQEDVGCQTVQGGVSNGALWGDTVVIQTVLNHPKNQQPPVVPLEGDAAGAALAEEIAGEVIEESTDGQAALSDDQPGTEVATIDDRAPVKPSPAEKPAKKTTRGARLPEGWYPDRKTVDRVREMFPGISREFLRMEHRVFGNYWGSASGSRATKVNWNMTWENWIIKTVRESPEVRWKDPEVIAATPVVSKKVQGYADAAERAKARRAAREASTQADTHVGMIFDA